MKDINLNTFSKISEGFDTDMIRITHQVENSQLEIYPHINDINMNIIDRGTSEYK